MIIANSKWKVISVSDIVTISLPVPGRFFKVTKIFGSILLPIPTYGRMAHGTYSKKIPRRQIAYI